MGQFGLRAHKAAITLFAGFAAMALAGEARAEYGAVASGHDVACVSAALRLHVAFNMRSQALADQAALAGCERGGTDCHIIMRFGKGRCAYINVTPTQSCTEASASAVGSTPQQAHSLCMNHARRVGAAYPCPAPIGGCNR